MQANTRITHGILTLLLFGLSTPVATAQSEIFGSGQIQISNGAHDGLTYFRHVAVNAWLDDDGIAHGTMIWQGDVAWFLPAPDSSFRGGPAVPYFMDVTDLAFEGNTVFVVGTVLNEPNHGDEGSTYNFFFTDNSGTDEPDLIDGEPVRGNFTVR